MAGVRKFEVGLLGGAYHVKVDRHLYNKATVIVTDSDRDFSIDAIVGVAQYNLFKGKKGNIGDEDKYSKIMRYLNSYNAGLIFVDSKLDFEKNLFNTAQ
jgi:hypothetical protein